jgi:hypothetical protein
MTALICTGVVLLPPAVRSLAPGSQDLGEERQQSRTSSDLDTAILFMRDVIGTGRGNRQAVQP